MRLCAPKKFKDFVAIVKLKIPNRNLFQVIDDLLAGFDKSFNKECISAVDATKCLYQFDSFELFDKEDLKTLYNHSSSDFVGYCDENLLLTEHVHYQNRLKKEFKKDLEVLTFAKITVWFHKKNAFPLIIKLLKLVCAILSSAVKEISLDLTLLRKSFVINLVMLS